VAQRLSAALQLNARPVRESADVARGVARFRADTHHFFEVSERSNYVRYSNQALQYGSVTREPPDSARAVSLVRTLLGRLEGRGLLRTSEVMWDQPEISHAYEEGAPAMGSLQAASPPRRVDTRVKYYRAVNGVPISGSFVRAVLNDAEDLTGLTISWRPLVPDQDERPVVSSKDDARGKFEAEIGSEPTAGTVDVMVNEYVYHDPSPHDPVAFLEPGYLFIYTVRTPVPDATGEFVVSKKMYRFYPATSHEEEQLPSAEAARRMAKRAAHPPDTRP
jgi:hypothetical protein